MSRHNRAAQFAPFAAVVGHEAAVSEAARLTQRRVELAEEELAVLDRRFRWLADHAHEMPRVRVIYFSEDARKAGGTYHTIEGFAERADAQVIEVDGATIPTPSVVRLEVAGYDE